MSCGVSVTAKGTRVRGESVNVFKMCGTGAAQRVHNDGGAKIWEPMVACVNGEQGARLARAKCPMLQRAFMREARLAFRRR